MQGRRHLIWGVLVFAYAINFFHSLSMGVVKADLMKDFRIDEAAFISIGNMYANLYLLMQIPAGLLVDWLNPRKTASLGMLLASVGVTLFGFSHSVPLLYVGRSLVGLGTSVLFVCILKIQANWFSESIFGTMTGWTCLIGTLGGALAQTPLALLTNLVGWRVSFIGVGVLSFGVTAAIFLLVRDHPDQLEAPGHPTELTGGAQSEQWNESSKDVLRNESAKEVQWDKCPKDVRWEECSKAGQLIGNLSGQLADGASQGRQEGQPSNRRNTLDMLLGVAHVLKNPYTWPVFFGYAGFYGSYVVLMGYYGTSFVMSVYGKSTVAASLFITVGVMGSAAGAAVIGSLSDKLASRKKPAVWMGAGYLICWIFLALESARLSSSILLILLFAIGFLSCAYVVSWPATKEVNHPEFMGVAASITNMGGFFGSILIPILAGKAFATGGGADYSGMFMLVAALAGVGLAGFLLMRETGCQNCHPGTSSVFSSEDQAAEEIL